MHHTMMIPARDAMQSRRFGFLTGDNFSIAAIMYANTKTAAMSDAWRNPKPIFIKSDQPIDIVDIIENNQYEPQNLSQEFWDKCVNLYDAIHNNNVSIESLSDTTEQRLFNGLCNVIYDDEDEISADLYNNVVKWANIRDQMQREHTPFQESDFTNQTYIPPYTDGLEFQLLNYETDNTNSLWVRIGEQEYPIIYDTDDMGMMISTTVDSGTIDSSLLDTNTCRALEQRETINAYTTDILSIEHSDKVATYLNRATDAHQ